MSASRSRMQSFVVVLAWVELAALVAGTVMALASGGGGDAAGRALGTAQLVIGVAALLIFLVVPALVLATTGRVVWLAAILAGLAALPAFVLGVGSLVGVWEFAVSLVERIRRP